MKLRVIALVAMLTIHGAIRAQQTDPNRQFIAEGPVELTVELSHKTALVAQPIRLTLQVDAPIAARIIPLSPVDTLGAFSVIGMSTANELPIKGRNNFRRWITSIEIECLDTGEQLIPSLEIGFRLPEKDNVESESLDGSLRSKPMTVQIASVLEDQDDPTQFRDIKVAAESAPVSERRSKLPWLPIGAAAAVLAIACRWWWKRRHRHADPRHWALEEIERIESQFQAKSIDLGESYAGLSDVLRGYLQQRFQIAATTQSSEELVGEVTAIACPDSAKQRLRDFLARADEVKFSGRPPSVPRDAESPFDTIRAIIDAAGGDARDARGGKQP